VFWPEIMAAAGEAVARPVGVAQARQSRLGETIRGSPRSVMRVVAQATRSLFLSERASRPGEKGLA